MGKWSEAPGRAKGVLMNTEALRAFIDSGFRVPVVEGENKVCPLDEAIRKHVKKGMSLSR